MTKHDERMSKHEALNDETTVSHSGLGFPSSLRITVGSAEQNDGVLRALGEFLTEQQISAKLSGN